MNTFKKAALLLFACCLTFSIAHAQNYPNAVLSISNLLGYWRFSAESPTNSSSGTNTSTFSGDAHIGPAGSGPALPGVPTNTAILFDGNGDFVTTTLVGGLNTNGPYANQGSIIAWFKLATLPSIAGRIFAIAGESVFGNDFDLGVETDNNIRFYTDGGSSTAMTNALTASDTNRWHFLAATFTANISRKVYLDGVLVGSSTPGGHNPAGNGTFSIGDSHFFTGRFFQGAIDEVAIFNRELTAAEVTNLYNGYASELVFTPACTNLTVMLSAGSTNCTVTTNDVTITNGLVAWYKADGNANDSYGTNNGILEGGVGFVASQSGQAFSILPPPAAQDVNIGLLKSLDHASGFTVSAYVKIIPTNNAFAVFSQGELPATNPPTAQSQSFIFAAATNSFSLTMPFANSSGTFSDFIRVNYNVSNQWQHLAATWRSSDGLTMLYANGVMVGSTNFDAGAVLPPVTNNLTEYPNQVVRLGNAFIGAASFGVSGFFDAIKINPDGGMVDNLRLYTRALSAAEIQQIMVADAGELTTNCVTDATVTTNLDFCTVPPGKLQILSAPPGNVQLFWPSQTNAFYLLQGSDEVSPLDWTTVWGAGPGNGSNVIVLDSTTSRPWRFYRLLSTGQ